MRKFSAAIILLLFTAIQLGTLAWYCYKPVLHTVCYQLFLRHESEGRAAKQSLVIHTTLDAWQAARQDEQEISWNGNLYDVIHTDIRGNAVILQVVNDAAENSWTSFFDHVHRQLTNNKSQQSPVNIAIYQWMFKCYMPGGGMQPPVAVIAGPSRTTVYPSHDLPSVTPGVPAQPPEAIG